MEVTYYCKGPACPAKASASVAGKLPKGWFNAGVGIDYCPGCAQALLTKLTEKYGKRPT